MWHLCSQHYLHSLYLGSVMVDIVIFAACHFDLLFLLPSNYVWGPEEVEAMRFVCFGDGY